VTTVLNLVEIYSCTSVELPTTVHVGSSSGIRLDTRRVETDGAVCVVLLLNLVLEYYP
jgi:hypothetical protein